MFPDQFIGIAVGRVGRKIEQPQPAVQALDKCFGLFGDMGRASIDVKKIARLAPVMRRLRNSMKTSALTPPLSLIMNRIRPREVIAEMRLMPWRAPVASTTGVSPFWPQLRPA